MPDFKLSFGVDGGDSISSGSGGSIKQDLDSIVSQINSKPYEIKLEADAKSFKDELSRITDFAKSQASEIKQAYKDALKGIQFPGGSGGFGGGGGNNGGKSRNSVIKKETAAYYKALIRLEQLKSKLNNGIKNWTAAENGTSSNEYKDLKRQERRVETLERLLGREKLTFAELDRLFNKITVSANKSIGAIDFNDEDYNIESKSLNQAVNDIKAYYDVQKEVLKLNADLKLGSDGMWYSDSGQFTVIADKLNDVEEAFARATLEAMNFSKASQDAFAKKKDEYQLDYLNAIEAKQRKDKSQNDKRDAVAESKSLSQAINDIKAYYDVQKEVLKLNADLKLGSDGMWYSDSGQFTVIADKLNDAEEAFARATLEAMNFSKASQDAFAKKKDEYQLDYLNAIEAKQRENDAKNIKLTEGVDGYEKALTSVNSKLIEVRKNTEAWSAAAKGSTAKDYKDLTDQVIALENLQGKLKRGELTAEQFAAAFSKINVAVSNSSEAIKHAGMAFENGADVKQYHEQVEKVSNLLVKVKKNIADWGAAKNGSSSASYIGLEKTAYELEDLRNNLLKTGVALDNFDNKFDDINYSVKRYSTDIELAGENTESAGSKIKDLAKALGISFTAMDAIHKAYEVGKKMFETVKEIDTAMTELKKVTDETDATYIRFLEDAKDRARDLGATVADTVSATADFARLGHPIDDAGALADAAIVYQNVGDGIEDITTSSESIISTMQAFGIEAKNAMSIVDSFNAVGNNFAISSGGIGQALLNSAASLHAAGNDIHEAVALIAAANTTIQDPGRVGTALKTMSMYLRAAKTEAEEAGLSTEGMANSVSELREELLALTGQKVDIMANAETGEYKSTVEILRDLASVWDDLSGTTRTNITELIGGGVRNANIISALMQNFEIVEDAIAISSESSGSALAENEKYLDSISGKVAQLQSSLESLSTSVMSSGFAKSIIELLDLFTRLGTVVSDIAFENIFTTLSTLTLGGGAVGFFKSLD